MELKTLSKMDADIAQASDNATEEDQMKAKQHEISSASSTLLQRLDEPPIQNNFSCVVQTLQKHEAP